jgi:2-isopropylmalate synthase
MPHVQLRVFDTTLRDGEQAPGFSLRPGEKLQVARQLQRLGVDVIEAGFAVASPAEAEAIRRIASEIRGPIIASLARARRIDLERAAWAVAPAAQGRIHTFIATSDLHLATKLRIDRAACLDAARDAVRLARQHTDDVQFSAEDAMRTEIDYLCRVVEAVIRAGATTINLPDTVGYATPDDIGEMFRRVIERVPNSDKVTFSTHCHDDLGMAVANSLAALAAGARQVECTVNGIGERAGNAALEEIVMATRVRADRLPYRTAIDPAQIYASSALLTRLTGQPVQANKAVVGRNAFAHEAGIHQDGILKDRRTYEVMRPEDVGAPSRSLVLGRHSGRRAVQHRCGELGLSVSGVQLTRVYDALMAVADKQKAITDTDVYAAAAAARAEFAHPVSPGDGDSHPEVPHEGHEPGYGYDV